MKSWSKIARQDRNVLVLCLGLTFGMLGMAYAAVPLYELFCQVTGYAGTTQRAEDTTGKVLDRTITIRFDANISNDLNWSFKPAQRSMTVRIGEKAQASYISKNIGTETSYGTATFNVSPGIAGAYFNKIDCFCFTEQKLTPGQTADMPVLFFVDPEIVNDPLLKDTKTITLSYTFFADEDAGGNDTVSERKTDRKVAKNNKAATEDRSTKVQDGKQPSRL